MTSLPPLIAGLIHRCLHGIAYGRPLVAELSYKSSPRPPPLSAWIRRCTRLDSWYTKIEWNRTHDCRSWYILTLDDRSDIVFLDVSVSPDTQQAHIHRGLAVVPWPAAERRILVDRVALPEIETAVSDLGLDEPDEPVYAFDTPFAANDIDAWVACIVELMTRM